MATTLMSEAEIIQHLHGILIDLRNLQTFRYLHEMNNPTEKFRFQDFINMSMTLINVEIKIRQTRLVDSYINANPPPPLVRMTNTEDPNTVSFRFQNEPECSFTVRSKPIN
jgi:hypothetical protein